MTLNVQKNAQKIEEAFNKVVSSKDGHDWVIFEYEGNSNVLKVAEDGDGGIEELASSFNSGRHQFGAISVRLEQSSLPKIVLINWHGEQVQSIRAATTALHAQELRRHLKTVHVLHSAYNEMDLEAEVIYKLVAKLPGTVSPAQVDSSYSAPSPVGAVYTPVRPHIDLNIKEREEFWKKMQKDDPGVPKERTADNPSPSKQTEELPHGTVEKIQPMLSAASPITTSPVPPPVASPTPSDSKPVKGVCAVALWDYQAADSTEISFEPEEVISEIEQVDEGWWKGRSPKGDTGFFPANYVRLLA